MPNHLSILGIVHTIISILAIIAGFVALFQQGVIDPRSKTGQWYVILTLLTCVTGFPIMRTGHFGPAHALSILVTFLLLVALFSRKWFGKAGVYSETILMSATFFLSFIPAVNESFTRLPLDHPVAADPSAPIIKMSIMILLGIYVAGVSVQVWKIRRSRVRAAFSR